MKTLIKNATIVNEGQLFKGDVLIEDERIAEITTPGQIANADKIIDAEGKYLFPGCIDD